MDSAVLNSESIATKVGGITTYNYDGETREYIFISAEYLAVGIDIPACSCLDAPGVYKAGYAIYHSVDLNSWEYVPDHRGEIVYNTETGDLKEIIASGDYPEKTTTIASLTPYDKRDGEKQVADTKTQHNAAMDTAELQRQPLIDDAMSFIVLIQLKLQAGRELTAEETVKLDPVLDYIGVVAAIDTSTAPDISQSKLSEIWIPAPRLRGFPHPAVVPFSIQPPSRALYVYQPEHRQTPSTTGETAPWLRITTMGCALLKSTKASGLLPR